MTDHECPWCQRPMSEHIDGLDCPDAIQKPVPTAQVPKDGKGRQPTEGDQRQVGASDAPRQSLAGTGRSAPGLHKATGAGDHDPGRTEVISFIQCAGCRAASVWPDWTYMCEHCTRRP